MGKALLETFRPKFQGVPPMKSVLRRVVVLTQRTRLEDRLDRPEHAVVVVSHVGHEARLHSYRLLAQAFS